MFWQKSAYLFIVTTPGKLTGWIGIPTESTASIITALKSWLTQKQDHIWLIHNPLITYDAKNVLHDKSGTQ
jgi:hypothetical protein